MVQNHSGKKSGSGFWTAQTIGLIKVSVVTLRCTQMDTRVTQAGFPGPDGLESAGKP